jgi:hypothetical protein
MKHTQYLRALLAIILIALGCIATFNAIVDPFDLYHRGDLQRDRFKDAIGSRLAKAEQVRRGGWDVILLGNSRVEVGLDPQHPGWGGAKVYNAGMPGAVFDETERMARLSFEKNPPRRIVLCVDLSDFDARRTEPEEDSLTLLNASLNRVDYRLGTLISINGLRKSIATLKNRCSDRPAGDWRLGQFDGTLANHGAADWGMANYYDFSGAEGATAGLYLDSGRMERLENLLDDASARGIKVDLVVLPAHVIFFQRVVLAGKWQLYIDWLTDLTGRVDRHDQRFPDQAVTFWDFSSYSKYTTGPYPDNARWYWDPGHFKKELGDRVIDRLTGYPAPAGEDLSNFGVQLDSKNLKQFIEELTRRNGPA